MRRLIHTSHRHMRDCCSVLQCVAVCVTVCCSVLVHTSHRQMRDCCMASFHALVAVCYSVLERVTVRQKLHSMRLLQCVVVCCSVLPCVAVVWQCFAVCCGVLHFATGFTPCACWSVLQCVAVCCSVLQCVAVCYSMLQCVAVRYRIPSVRSPHRYGFALDLLTHVACNTTATLLQHYCNTAPTRRGLTCMLYTLSHTHAHTHTHTVLVCIPFTHTHTHTHTHQHTHT